MIIVSNSFPLISFNKESSIMNEMVIDLEGKLINFSRYDSLYYYCFVLFFIVD